MTGAAEKYDKETVSYQGKDGLCLIHRISPDKDIRVLDLGCGTGYLSSVLAEQVGPQGSVTGVDPDLERILFARKKYGTVNHLNFVEGSCENFPAGPYNLVFCNHVLHWVENIETTFENVHRNLTPGGIFALCGVEEISPVVVEMQKCDVEDSIFHWSSTDFESAASKCSFEVDYKSIEPKTYTFPNVEAFVGWSQASTNSSVDTASFEEHVKKYMHTNEVFEFGLTLVILIFRKIG